MRMEPATLFGKTKLMPVRTYTNCRQDKVPAEDWVHGADVWIREGNGDEDYYTLSNRQYNFPGLPIRVLHMKDWRAAELLSEEKEPSAKVFCEVYRYQGKMIVPKYQGRGR